MKNLHIRNWPTHLFSISSCSSISMYGMLLDNSAGDAPNAISGGLPAAHNSDGFDISTTNDSVIYDNTVYNQDDCVAITSGNNITVSNMYCSGGHGLSIGSVGGKSNNNVTNILVSCFRSAGLFSNANFLKVRRQHRSQFSKRPTHQDQLQYHRLHLKHHLQQYRGQ